MNTLKQKGSSSTLRKL